MYFNIKICNVLLVWSYYLIISGFGMHSIFYNICIRRENESNMSIVDSQMQRSDGVPLAVCPREKRVQRAASN